MNELYDFEVNFLRIFKKDTYVITTNMATPEFHFNSYVLFFITSM